MYLLTFFCFKADNSPGVITGVFQFTIINILVVPGRGNIERLININNKKVLKVIGYRAAVFGTVANNFPLAGDNFYVRTFIKRID